MKLLLLRTVFDTLMYTLFAGLIFIFLSANSPIMCATFPILVFILILTGYAFRSSSYRYLRITEILLFGSVYITAFAHSGDYLSKQFENFPSFKYYFLFFAVVGFSGAILLAHKLFTKYQQKPTRQIKPALYLTVAYIYLVSIIYEYIIESPESVIDIFTGYHATGIFLFPIVLAFLSIIYLTKNKNTIIRIGAYIISSIYIILAIMHYPSSGDAIFSFYSSAALLCVITMGTLFAMDAIKFFLPKLRMIYSLNKSK